MNGPSNALDLVDSAHLADLAKFYMTFNSLLPPANVVWGKVMFYTCLSAHKEGVCLGGGLHRGVLL